MWCQNLELIGYNMGIVIPPFIQPLSADVKEQDLPSQIENGKWSLDLVVIKEKIVEFYQKLCTSRNPSSNDICSLVEPKLTASMVAAFDETVLPVEVKIVVFQLEALKAPGPDGMLGIFYQHC